jgi:hypothetical protein
MSRYLNEEQLKTNLSLGKAVEQWLGSKEEKDYTILKWLSIERKRNGKYTVAFIECFDDGSSEFTDIYEFSLLDPDEPEGIINTFITTDEALNFAESKYNASISKYVSSGMIQEDYKEYLRS